MSSHAVLGTGAGFGKPYRRWQAGFVLAVFACGIVSAQSPAPAEMGVVPERQSIVNAALPDAPQQAPQDGSQAEAKPGIVIGTVLDRSGSVSAGATVRLTSQTGSYSQQVTSGNNGEFSFMNVPPGPFKVSVTAEGFGKQEFSGELASGQTFLVPALVISVATVVTDVKVTVDPVEVATEQVTEQVHQRVLGIFPNFYVSYRQDAAPLTTKLKFRLAWKSSTDPVTILGTAFLAGLQQAGDQYGEFGQGAEGYAKRFGADYADVLASTYLSGAIFPSLLKQDPRYFYRGTGSTRSRFAYAVGNSVMCKGDNGHWQVNYSNIAGSFGGAALSTTFFPTSNPGMTTLSNGFIRLGESSLAGVVQEFLLKRFTKMKRLGKNGSGSEDGDATESDPGGSAKKP